MLGTNQTRSYDWLVDLVHFFRYSMYNAPSKETAGTDKFSPIFPRPRPRPRPRSPRTALLNVWNFHVHGISTLGTYLGYLYLPTYLPTYLIYGFCDYFETQPNHDYDARCHPPLSYSDGAKYQPDFLLLTGERVQARGFTFRLTMFSGFSFAYLPRSAPMWPRTLVESITFIFIFMSIITLAYMLTCVQALHSIPSRRYLRYMYSRSCVSGHSRV